MNKQKGFSIIELVALASIVTIAFLGTFSAKQSSEKTAPIPAFIQANFIDIARVAAISKFRSGSGHDFSKGSGETCRSMKHYFNVPRPTQIEQLIAKNNGLPPEPDGKTDIPIFSPVDGKITSVDSNQFGKQIYIQPEAYKSFTVRLFHIYPLPDIKKGAKVKAGQKIGVIGQYQNTDVAVMQDRTKYISYFEVMSPALFAKYQAVGIKNRTDLIISKEERDKNPLKCNGEWFAKNYDSDPNYKNFVYINARQQATKKPSVSPPPSSPSSYSPSVPLSTAPKRLLSPKSPFETKAEVSFEYYWPGESGHSRLSSDETEFWVFNENTSGATISRISFVFFLDGTETSLLSGTWERFPSRESWERIDYVNIGKGEYTGTLVLNPSEKGKIHYHVVSASPLTKDKKLSAQVKILFSIGNENYTIDKTLNR